MKSFSGLRDARSLEFAAGRHISVVLDKDGLIYRADETIYPWAAYRWVDHWRATT